MPVASHVTGETPKSRRGVAAGTQAPPVDTKFAEAVMSVLKHPAITGVLPPKPKYKDRHKPGYQAQKQREYRAQRKAKASVNLPSKGDSNA